MLSDVKFCKYCGMALMLGWNRRMDSAYVRSGKEYCNKDCEARHARKLEQQRTRRLPKHGVCA